MSQLARLVPSPRARKSATSSTDYRDQEHRDVDFEQELLDDICNDVLGYGPLEPLLARDVPTSWSTARVLFTLKWLAS